MGYTPYTPKQKTAIDRGFTQLHYYLSNGAQSQKWALAFAYEKKGRGITNAKALALRCYFDGYDNPSQPLSEVAVISQGLLIITALGANDRKWRTAHPIPERDLALMRAGVAAHEENQTKRLNAIRDTEGCAEIGMPA